MKLNSLFILVSLFILSLTACDNDDNEFEAPTSRTVLIYVAGDNSLNSYVNENIKAIKRGIEQNGLNNGNLLIYTDDSHNAP
ncbi:hypothetical protein, secreted, partial [gut metagenome]